MNLFRHLLATAALLLGTALIASAQEPVKPGPEHEHLKKWVGSWDVTMTMAGMETKGKSNFKLEVGGIWLVSDFEVDLGPTKFIGKGLDSYDAVKKRYTSVWVDSWSGSPMTMVGNFDKDKKALTMSGEGTGPDGKPMKFKSVTEWKDDNTVNFTMYMGDVKEPGFTIVYKRKK